MRGQENPQLSMFSYLSLEHRIPANHPLRRLRLLVDGILSSMSDLFDERYSHTGRPSIPPEHLLRALLLQIMFTVRSERLLMEQLDYNLLFRWFVGLGMDRLWPAELGNPHEFTLRMLWARQAQWHFLVK